MSLAPLRSWLRPPRQVLTLFLGITTALSGAMGWFAWQFVARDREVVAQRTSERLEAAAALAVTMLRRGIDDIDRRLESLAAAEAPTPAARLRDAAAGRDRGAVWVLADEGRVDAWPAGALVAYPTAALARPSAVLPAATFAAGELLEHPRHDPVAALTAYSLLARSADPRVRGAALLRVARVQANMGQPDAALDTYRELAALGSTATELGPPAGLVAQYGRCVVLGKAGRQPDLEREAAILERDLRDATWRLTWAEYLSYRGEAHAWLGKGPPDATSGALTDAEQFSAALAALWDQWHPARAKGPPDAGSRRLRSEADIDVTVVWRRTGSRLAAVLATPAFVEATVVAPARAAIAPYKARLILDDMGPRTDGDGVPGVSRVSATTRLPWSLEIVDAAPGSDVAAAESRRRLVVGALIALGLFVFAGGAFIVRAINRETELLRLQRDFVSAVSHEFRTPLTSIAQVNEVLLDGRVPEPLREEYYRLQQRESQRLQGLVESLLDFGRMESGAHAYRFEAVDASDVAAAVAADFAKRAAASGYSIEIDLSFSAPVSADREALGRAIRNLLDNAVKYSPTNKTILLTVGEHKGRVEIAVRDRGVGVPPADRERIFDTFTRGANAAATGARGTGVGLAMVRHIARAHGGDVSVDSTLGEGSTFTILLPPAAPKPPAIPGDDRVPSADR